MALFNRSKKQPSVLPDEVSQYYQSQRRERTSVAITLGVVALVVTLLIGAALFFGGRFVYREFIQDDKTSETAEPQSDNTQPAQGTFEEGTTDTMNQTDTSSGTSTPGSGNADEETGATNTTPSTTTPSTGDDTLPRTGDEPL